MIISLIVGGVIGGKKLIESSRLNKIISQVKEYQVATNNFILQYDALPGDMPNPKEYIPSWTQVADGYAKGNGNGVVDVENETAMYFKHLSLFGFIAGEYHNSGCSAEPEVCVPSGPLAGSGFYAKSPNFARSKHYYHFGGYAAALPGANNFGTLNGRHSKLIDRKMDDGEPESGVVQASVGVYTPAYTIDCRTVYPLDTPEIKDCNLDFMLIP